MNRPAPPGFLGADVHPEVVGMICTAGHVDHGKTRLVGMLTGCSTDRLKEERERGLTIELGFAPCFLGDNLCVGIVDVPGHERFVRTMVAGVSGIDLALLVVAADDGIMPQTVEHLQILEMLGVRHGMAVLTKTDLVAPDLLAQRMEEAATFLRGTFLEGAPVLPVSSETGAGYGEFYGELVARIRALRRRPNDGVFRMPVERLFRREGFGEVISGIAVSGRIRTGDAVALSPGGQTGKVRGLQCFLRSAEEGGAGQCLALNVPEWGKHPPQRGQVVTLPGYLSSATLFYARLHAVPRLDPPLRHAEAVRFHAGTADMPAKVYLLEETELPGGGSAAATIRTARPVAAAAGDRFLLRRVSPAATVAGGRIALAESGDRRPRRAVMLETLLDCERFFADAAADADAPDYRDRQVEFALYRRGMNGATVPDLARDALLTPSACAESCARLREAGRILEVKEGEFLHRDALRNGCEIGRACLDKARKAGRLLVPLVEFRKWLPSASSAARNAVCLRLEEDGAMAREDQALLLYADPASLPVADRALAERILRLYADTGYRSPHPSTLAETLAVPSADAARILEYLIRARRLVALSDAVVLDAGHYRAAQDMAVETIRSAGVLDSPAFRDRLNTTRKYAMTLLDYMDAQGITVRSGNTRKLLPDYTQRLWK